MDYSINIQVVISLVYVGTGGLNIGLIHSAQGIEGGKNWGKTFTYNSLLICEAIINVVVGVISHILKAETQLTISEKLREIIVWRVR